MISIVRIVIELTVFVWLVCRAITLTLKTIAKPVAEFVKNVQIKIFAQNVIQLSRFLILRLASVSVMIKKIGL